MAKTIASGLGMTNDWLASQIVLSLKTLWAELAPLRGTARCGPACLGGVGWARQRAGLPDFCRISATLQDHPDVFKSLSH
jgi:hypothetical protein